MTTMAGDRIFVDTNILIYANLAASPLRATAITRLQDLEAAGGELWISRQTLREYLCAMTKPGLVAGAAMSLPSLIADVQNFAADLELAEDGPAVTANLLALLMAVPAGGKQVYDANIVATMQAHGITKLLTHNTADFARFASLITILPLVP